MRTLIHWFIMCCLLSIAIRLGEIRDILGKIAEAIK